MCEHERHPVKFDGCSHGCSSVCRLRNGLSLCTAKASALVLKHVSVACSFDVFGDAFREFLSAEPTKIVRLKQLPQILRIAVLQSEANMHVVKFCPNDPDILKWAGFIEVHSGKVAQCTWVCKPCVCIQSPESLGSAVNWLSKARTPTNDDK